MCRALLFSFLDGRLSCLGDEKAEPSICFHSCTLTQADSPTIKYSSFYLSRLFHITKIQTFPRNSYNNFEMGNCCLA